MSDFHPLTNLRRFVTDLTRGQTVIPAEHLEAADDLTSGPQVTAADFDWNDAPGMTFHPAYIDQHCAEWAREVQMCADSELWEMTRND